jgi:endonuclease/exonuclease/phosphatase family metal-dependent hydrolase
MAFNKNTRRKKRVKHIYSTYKRMKLKKNKSKRMKSKRTKGKRTKGKSNLNGGNKERLQKQIFSLMTFNVELFLNLYNFSFDDKMIIDVQPNENKMSKFQKLFNDIDVACIQETVISAPDTKYPLFKDPIENEFLKQKSICQSHLLDWPRSQMLYGNPSYLANAIYVSNEIEASEESQSIQINKSGLERCFTSVIIQVLGKPIKIATVHLVGGRFDDILAIQSDSYVEEKENQLKSVVNEDPDIICGDFNTKLRMPNIIENTDKYFMSLIKPDISQEEIRNLKERWEKWIYMDRINSYLNQNGYQSVYVNENDDLITNIQDTSAYGAIVDMIYYKPEKLSLVPESVAIVGQEEVMEKKPGSGLYTPILSDHFPVKVEFQVL